MEGTVEESKLHYIIRDHDMAKFQEKKAIMEAAADFINRKYGAGTCELSLRDSYFNMKQHIEPVMYIVDRVKTAMRNLGIEPKEMPIRGGTDGARLSYMGLPCPNICTGGENFHGRFEYIPVEDLEKITKLLVEILTSAT
jgi:tripeptide aminopeptidase